MKKIASLSLAIFIACSLMLSLSGCGVSESAVIGVWESTHTDYNAYHPYIANMYIYKDGTGDWYGSFSGADHLNAFTWEIEGEYLVIKDSDGSVDKYTVNGDELLDSRGKTSFNKISNDTSVDVPLKKKPRN